MKAWVKETFWVIFA